ncbi:MULTISPECIES: LysR family transcriptional regulator [unclassified Pyramidobacter]|uniref:LysR family transcriptional regulator n=1 Tax=unclassified Pyramidobacter TaxID=2632171 RepID=UPI00131566B7|nr:LysR family transcriptional regulator [Pyramidobacter sp. CG50-2]
MSLLSLRYFLTAAEEMNFTAAAKQLYITQQTLSMHIARLEREYQVELFRRKPKLSLTPEGERMVKYASRIVRLERVMSAEFADLDQNARGVLSLGISRMRARYFFHRLWQNYREQFPNIEIHLHEGSADVLEKLSASRKTDLCIGIEMRPSPSICVRPLLREDFYCTVSKDLFRSFCGEKAGETAVEFSRGLSFERLPDLPLLLLSPINRLRRIVDRHMDAIDRIVRPVFESNDLELLVSMCENGAGVTFLPATILFLTEAAFARTERICAFPVNGIQIETSLVYPSDLELPHYAQAFIGLCEEVFAESGAIIRSKSAAYLKKLQTMRRL